MTTFRRWTQSLYKEGLSFQNFPKKGGGQNFPIKRGVGKIGGCSKQEGYL